MAFLKTAGVWAGCMGWLFSQGAMAASPQERNREAAIAHKASEALPLDQTGIGKAVLSGSLERYQEELKKLKAAPYEEAYRALTAKTKAGNNLLHLMARAPEPLSHQIAPLFIGFFLPDEGAELILQGAALNASGLSPKDVAEKAENNIAYEHLTYIDNWIKQESREEDLSLAEGIVRSYLKDRERQSNKVKNLSAFAAGVSTAALLSGLAYPSLELLVFGSIMQGITGMLCHEVFKKPDQQGKSQTPID